MKSYDQRNEFGFDMYQISDAALEPWANPHFGYGESELVNPNRQAFMAWKAHAVQNGYRMIVIIIPPEWFFNQEGRYTEFISFLNSQHIEYIDLSEEFRNRKIPASDLYWAHDNHTSEKGNVIIGNILASFFRTDPISGTLVDCGLRPNSVGELQKCNGH